MARDYQRLQEQDKKDAQKMAFAISTYLHHSTGIPNCEDPNQCLMCSNATRLAVQHYRPIMEQRVVQSVMDMYNVSCNLPHPGGD